MNNSEELKITNCKINKSKKRSAIKTFHRKTNVNNSCSLSNELV